MSLLTRWFRRRKPERGATHIMDDPAAPMVCSHCGAAWDEAHENGHCGVKDATARILNGYVPRRPG